MLFNIMSERAQPLLQKIHAHPFNQALSRGSLEQEKFVFYLKQDALYLADFSRALEIIATKLSDPDHAKQFQQFSLDALQAERDLHSNYLARFNAKGVIEKGPACALYTQYIFTQVTTASVGEGLASVLPCFWVYQEVGERIAVHPTKNNPYQEWIDLYSNPAFKTSVNAAIEITNAVGETASSIEREKMIEIFLKSTEFEWLFWDNAYHLEKWPVATSSENSRLIPEALSL